MIKIKNDATVPKTVSRLIQFCTSKVLRKLANQFLTIHVGLREGGGSRVVVSTAAFHARVRGLVPGLSGLKKNKKCFFPIHV